MSKGYSRQQKKSTKTNTDSTQSPAKHIKTGFSALQKTIALVGSVLSIIVASITITNAINNHKDSSKTDSSTSKTVIIRESGQNSSNQVSTEKDETRASYSQTLENSSASSTPSSSSNSAANNDQTSSSTNNDQTNNTTTDTSTIENTTTP